MIMLTMARLARMPPTFAALADSLLKYRLLKKPALVRFPFTTFHLFLDWNKHQLTLARHHHARQLLPE